MSFRFDVALVVAALMLSSPHVAAACSSSLEAGPQQHSVAVDELQTADLRTEPAAAETVADGVEAAFPSSFLQTDDLDAFDARRFVGPHHDEIAVLIAASFATADTDATGSISVARPAADWALDGLEDR